MSDDTPQTPTPSKRRGRPKGAKDRTARRSYERTHKRASAMGEQWSVMLDAERLAYVSAVAKAEQIKKSEVIRRAWDQVNLSALTSPGAPGKTKGLAVRWTEADVASIEAAIEQSGLDRQTLMRAALDQAMRRRAIAAAHAAAAQANRG